MTEEGEAHIGVAPDAVESLVGVTGSVFDGVGAQVGQLARFEVAPDQFDGVEVMSVGGERFDNQPVALSSDPGLHHLGAVRGQTVPDQGELVAANVGVQIHQELDERLVVVGAGTHVEHQPGVGPVGGKTHGGRHREALPVEVVREDRGLSFGRPGSPHRGEEAEA